MKNLTYLFSAVILLALLATTGCKKDDDPGLSEEEQQLELLTGTWTATSVNDGTIDRQDYDGFTMTFNNAMTYATGGGPDLLPMPTSGDFEFGSNIKTQLVLDPNGAAINATYALNADANQLTLNFTYQGDGFDNAKTNSVNGNWTFVFTK